MACERRIYAVIGGASRAPRSLARISATRSRSQPPRLAVVRRRVGRGESFLAESESESECERQYRPLQRSRLVGRRRAGDSSTNARPVKMALIASFVVVAALFAPHRTCDARAQHSPASSGQGPKPTVDDRSDRPYDHESYRQS